MSGLYEIKELNVINEEMLAKALEDQEPQKQAGLLEESLTYDKVTELRLDYRSTLLSHCQFCCVYDFQSV